MVKRNQIKMSKKLNILIIILFLSSCGTLKEGFVNSKKENSDEFLVEKKMPLKMPPSFNELPEPKENKISQNNQDETEDEIKSLITKTDNQEENKIEKKELNKNLKETLLEKIKEN